MNEAKFQKEFRRADGHMRTGDPAGAMRILVNLPEEWKTRIEVGRMAIVLCHMLEMWEQAEDMALQSVQNYPENGGMWYLLAVTEANMGKMDSARESARLACELDPELRMTILKDDALKELF